MRKTQCSWLDEPELLLLEELEAAAVDWRW
jgi:hypothetical protein